MARASPPSSPSFREEPAGRWHAVFVLGEAVDEAIPGPVRAGKTLRVAWRPPGLPVRTDAHLRRTPQTIALAFGAGLRFCAGSCPAACAAQPGSAALRPVAVRAPRFRLQKTPMIRGGALYAAFRWPAAPRPKYGSTSPARLCAGLTRCRARPRLAQHPDDFAVADPRHSVIVASPDVPLLQVNGINTGNWQEPLLIRSMAWRCPG